MEILKEKSDFLRHPLMEQLVTEESNISEEAVQLMKFHGSYQQDDRYLPDSWATISPYLARCCLVPSNACQAGYTEPQSQAEAGAAPCNRDKRSFGQGKFYQFMMRTRQPAGLVSNQLYLTMDDLADQVLHGALPVLAAACALSTPHMSYCDEVCTGMAVSWPGGGVELPRGGVELPRCQPLCLGVKEWSRLAPGSGPQWRATACVRRAPMLARAAAPACCAGSQCMGELCK